VKPYNISKTKFLTTGQSSAACEDSEYGCCQDLKTPAQGPQNEGCPSKR